MKAAKTWSFAGVLVLVGIATASCGKDEATGGQGGSGTVIGGEGGTSGSGGTAGGRPVGGTTGTASSKLGQACLNDGQCADTTTPGLTCVTAKETVLGEGAPPKGLCTAECADTADCTQFGEHAVCFPFDSTTGYCVEGCAFGEPDIGTQKCHSRPEFACNPALLAPTTTSCTATEDCPAGDLCIDGTCDAVLPACLPACRGDIDCEDGMYCDQSFLSGVCLSKKPTGKALGEPCTVPGANDPSEPDECLGFCQADAEDSNKGHCAATCGIGRECAWNSATSKFDGICLYASVLTAETGSLGDFGFCTPSCNCTDECNDPKLVCQLLEQGALTEDFKGPGLCFSENPDGSTKPYNQCSGTGGAGNEGGAGGVPSSNGGEPAAGGIGGAGG
jgi:hypothetical protein